MAKWTGSKETEDGELPIRARAAHGTARVATQEETAMFSRKRKQHQPQPAPQPRSHYLQLGYFDGDTIGLNEQQQENHVLIVGTTGKGKTSSVILPGLYRETGTRSLFIIDPKSELIQKTAGAISRYHQVQIFAPTQPTMSAQYNPLAFIRNEEDALDFADCWIQNTGGAGHESFWSDGSHILITGVTLHLRTEQPDAPLYELERLLSLSLDKLYSVLQRSRSQHVQVKTLPFIEDLLKAERTAAGIKSDLATRLRWITDDVRRVTQTNELDFTAMITQARPTALYLSIPTRAAHRLRPLSACLLMQMFGRWEELAEQYPGQALPRGVCCYLDEFANAGRIPKFDVYVSTFRSKRIALLLAVQNFAQLEAVYGRDDKNTIIANTSTHLVLPGSGLEECRYYSERCGVSTVPTTSTSTSTSIDPLARGLERMTEGRSYSEAARPLKTPDEIRTLPRGEMLMLVENYPPFFPKTIPYYQDPEIAHLVNIPYYVPIRPVRPLPEPEPRTSSEPDVPPEPPELDEPPPDPPTF